MGKFLDSITLQGGVAVKDGDALGVAYPDVFTVKLTSAVQSAFAVTFSLGAAAQNTHTLASSVGFLMKALQRQGIISGTSTEG